ncbi:hypothetical protein BDP27DRAFT_1375822, partial [Rhodocollybia butyracea]
LAFSDVNYYRSKQIFDGAAASSVTVGIAANRGYTSLSFGGQYTSDFPITFRRALYYHTNVHTQNHSMPAVTALAIAYVILTLVALSTPWKPMTTYDIPADMPAWPRSGGWISNACSQANIYHEAIRCTVTGATSTTPVGTPQPPVWCKDDPSACITGPKQMLYWPQASGNNIKLTGTDLAGELKSQHTTPNVVFVDGSMSTFITEGVASEDVHVGSGEVG